MKIYRVGLVCSISAILFLVSDCYRRESRWKGKIEEIKGVTIVRNPAMPMYDENEGVFELKEDSSIRVKEGLPEYVFSKIQDLDVDAEGNIYVLDPREAQVKVFDTQGVYLRTIGRRGQGPGETQNPVFIQVTAQGELAIYDHHASGMLLFYSLDGVYLRQKTTQSIVFPIGLDSKGRLLAQYIFPPPDGRKVILRYDVDGSGLELAREEMGKDKVFEIGRPSCYGALSPNDTILWGDSKEYRLYLMSAEGRVVKIITKEFHSLAITEREKDEYREKYADALKSGMQLSFRDRFPAFSGVFFDDEGRILVRTYERAGGSGDSLYFDVFDKDGVYESRVAVPVILDRNSVWKGGRLYTVESAESGRPLIKRYRITWKTGGLR